MKLWSFALRFFVMLLATVLVSACGGGNGSQNYQPPPPPPPTSGDFSLSVSPVSASAVIGKITPSVTVSVSPKNGFNSSVNVTFEGLPSGVDATPGPPPIVLAPGTSQPVTFSVSTSAPVGIFQITVKGASGAISHSAQLVLNTEPTIRVSTYQSGSVLYLESNSPTDSSRIGLQAAWGGSIVEVSLNGTNFVNQYDTGREVQVALWDGSGQYDNCAGCSGVFGWNATQGGDRYSHGSPLLSQLINPESLYIETQPYQWYPDDKGGGPNQPVLADVYVEATISAVPDHASTFKVHYKIIHIGTDQHTNTVQEFPAVYVNLGFDRFVRDSSTTPWTNTPVVFATMPQLGLPCPTLYASEDWGAFVDTDGNGLTVFVPGVMPYAEGYSFAGDPGPSGSGTDYFHPGTFFTFDRNSVLEGDVYLIAGDYKHARQVIYDLHNRLPAQDVSTPIAAVDSPTANAQLSGTVSVNGWAFDNVAVAKVDVYVDGTLAGTASYGESRPDVANVWPHAPVAIGYSFVLNTTLYANGPHAIQIKAIDTTGNVAVFPETPVTVQN